MWGFFLVFKKKYFLTCSLVVFFQMKNSDSPSVFAAKKILVLHFPYDCTNQYWDIQFMLSVQRGIVYPRGGQHTWPLFNHFLKQDIKARTKNSIITKAPHENVKMITRWWVPGIHQLLSHTEANWFTSLIDSFIYLFCLTRRVEPTLVRTHRGWKEPRSKAKPIVLLGFREEDKRDERVSGYNHVTLRNPTPLIKDPSPGQTHRHGQTRSKPPPAAAETRKKQEKVRTL